MPVERVATVSLGSGERSSSRRLTLALAVTQTIGYGVLSYAFRVLLAPIVTDLHTSTAAVTGALAVSVVVAAAAAVPCGRWLDRYGGRALMTTGSLLGVAAVVAWSQVRQVWQLYVVFVAIGLASAASLYEAAFPVLIAAAARGRRDRVTIVAGFSSSIFFPLTGVLLAQFGWRSTLLVLAAILAAVVGAMLGAILANPPGCAPAKVVGPGDTVDVSNVAGHEHGTGPPAGLRVSHCAFRLVVTSQG